MLTQTIPAYVYQEYSDDSDIQAFNTNYNEMAQAYVTWFATANLPIYTAQSGPLLDWVANGIYGEYRATLQGALVSDDVFQRCITWDFYKGDGQQFNIRWLKRRLMRFLTGTNGTDPGINQTYNISVTFGTPNIVYINILGGIAEIIGGIEFNQTQYNAEQFNELDLSIQNYLISTLQATLQEAINSGVLQLPFQFVYIVGISP
jgi:hypothetical protein